RAGEGRTRPALSPCPRPLRHVPDERSKVSPSEPPETGCTAFRQTRSHTPRDNQRQSVWVSSAQIFCPDTRQEPTQPPRPRAWQVRSIKAMPEARELTQQLDQCPE